MKHNVGGGEVTNDFYTVSVTGAFTVTCTFDRLYHPDGKGFSDEEMIAVGKDYISNENFRIGRDTNTDRYFITGSQRLTKDDATKLLKERLINIWKEDIEVTKEHDPDNEFIELATQEIAKVEPLETYEEVRNAFKQFVYDWEPRSADLFEYLVELFVEG